MKIEIDTLKDSKEDIKKAISLLNSIVFNTENDYNSNSIISNPNSIISKSDLKISTSKIDSNKVLDEKTTNDTIIMPSKEDLQAFKKGNYKSKDDFQNKKSLESIKKFKADDNYNEKSKQEPKVEIY